MPVLKPDLEAIFAGVLAECLLQDFLLLLAIDGSLPVLETPAESQLQEASGQDVLQENTWPRVHKWHSVEGSQGRGEAAE